MACKNCKAKDVAKKAVKDFTDTTTNVTDSLQAKKMEILRKSWEGSMGKFHIKEQIVLALFAWIPLIIGYVYIIKFFISLF